MHKLPNLLTEWPVVDNNKMKKFGYFRYNQMLIYKTISGCTKHITFGNVYVLSMKSNDTSFWAIWPS